MRKFTLLTLVVAAIAVPVARADQPGRFGLTSFDTVDTTSCAFPVAVHITSQGETLTVFSNRSLITGPIFAEFSANGKSVSINTSGPGFFTSNPDGSVTIVARGVSSGPLQTGNGVTIGYWAGVATIDPATGIATLEDGTLLLDICAALSA
jgi:hypothetical protein